jgi:hypothetical protein
MGGGRHGAGLLVTGAVYSGIGIGVGVLAQEVGDCMVATGEGVQLLAQDVGDCIVATGEGVQLFQVDLYVGLGVAGLPPDQGHQLDVVDAWVDLSLEPHHGCHPVPDVVTVAVTVAYEVTGVIVPCGLYCDH